jgi:hypothetical protein
MPTNLLSTTSVSILGTWNVRTIYQSGKPAQIAKKIHKYKIEVMGLSETRWISTGKTILATGEVVLYSGHQEEDSPHTEGVAFMMTKEASKVQNILGTYQLKNYNCKFSNKTIKN